MTKALNISLVIICFIFTISSTTAQETAFQPVNHKYIYDVQDDGIVRCIWSTTIIPKALGILYAFSFSGGETNNFHAEDSLGQIIDVDAIEQNGQRNITLVLTGYQVDRPYQFNVSFDWNGLITRNGERNTLFTSVNIGDPQAAEITVIPPEGAKIATSLVTKGNSSEPFQKEVISRRNVLIWRSNNTGNAKEILFRASFNYFNARMSLSDNLSKILTGTALLLIAALLLGGRKKLPGIASKIKEYL